MLLFFFFLIKFVYFCLFLFVTPSFVFLFFFFLFWSICVFLLLAANDTVVVFGGGTRPDARKIGAYQNLRVQPNVYRKFTTYALCSIVNHCEGENYGDAPPKTDNKKRLSGGPIKIYKYNLTCNGKFITYALCSIVHSEGENYGDAPPKTDPKQQQQQQERGYRYGIREIRTKTKAIWIYYWASHNKRPKPFQSTRTHR